METICTSATALLLPDDLARDGFTAEWFDVSPRQQDRSGEDMGLFTSLLRLYDAGAEAGYVAITFTTEEMIESMSANFWLFMDRWTGWSPFRDGKVDWATVHHYAGRCPKSLEGTGVRTGALSSGLIPDEATQIDDLAELERHLRRERIYEPRERMKYHAIPYVSYSQVLPEWRGRGLGAVMYVAAARKLADAGRVLAASTCRTADALRLWDRLVAAPDVPTRMIDRHDQMVPAIDFC